jgi:hypothetical protein
VAIRASSVTSPSIVQTSATPAQALVDVACRTTQSRQSAVDNSGVDRSDAGAWADFSHPGRIINESATQNEEGEHVGWINRVFGSVYQVRLVGKRMKAWNKHAYYATKYLIIGGILAAFLATAFA